MLALSKYNEKTSVEQVCELLGQAPQPAVELAGQLGTVETQGRSAVYVRPAAPAFKQIVLSRDRATGLTTSAELILADPAALRVAAMTRLFGGANVPPKVSWDSPTRLHFRVEPSAGRPIACVVVAALADGSPASEEAKIQSVTVIPEP